MNYRSRLTLLVVLFSATAVAADEPVLPSAVRSVLQLRQIPAGDISIRVDNLTRGESLLAWRADELRTPASVMKLVTTLVALDTLGPSYTWTTNAWFLGGITDGTLHGDLLLQGKGDPFLVIERLWMLQRQIRQAGIRNISGDLLLDDSYFKVGNYDPAAFDHEPLRAYNVEPNALMTNLKVVRFLFSPAEDGRHVEIRMEPQLGDVAIVNRLSVTPGACRGYRRGIAISPNATFDEMTFSGHFPAGCTRYALNRTVLDHSRYTYDLFRTLWEESGGSLDGQWKKALAPEDRDPDLVFESLPLGEVIARINKHSNNVMARQLLYTLGAELGAVPGTEAAGRDAVVAWLAARHFDFRGFQIDNGAGLSRDARVTASQLARLLHYGYASPYMPEYLASLSLPGMDGTLSRRFRDAAMQGTGHLKTGSLENVSSIAGYLQARSGDRFAVVVIVNHKDSHRGTGEEVEEALLRWVREH